MRHYVVNNLFSYLQVALFICGPETGLDGNFLKNGVPKITLHNTSIVEILKRFQEGA